MATKFSNVSCYAYDAESKVWRGLDSVSSNVAAKGIRMFSYNILFDLMDDSNQQQNEARVSHIVSLIESIVDAGASRDEVIIVCLQEVTPRICRVILANPAIRKVMYCSASPNTTESVHPYGQLLLVNNPFNCAALRFGKHKSVVSLSMCVNGINVCGVGLHLTSNYASQNDGATEVTQKVLKKRNHQLRACIEQAESEEACFLMGDFNFGDDDADQTEDGAIVEALRNGWVDVWPTLHPGPTDIKDAIFAHRPSNQPSDDPGFTFDTKHNALAEHSSRRPKRKRYDRILVKGTTWNLETVRIIGRVPVIERAGQQNLPPSDHFGVLCTAKILSEPVVPHLLSFDSLELMMASQPALLDSVEKRNRVIEQGRSWVEAAAQQHSCEISMVTTIGSTFLGTALPTSDVDMVVIGTGDRDAILGSIPSGTYVHEGITVPILKSHVEGVPLEIQYVQLVDGRVPETPSELIRLAMGMRPAERYPLLALADSLVISRYARAAFRECFRFLKLWASRAGIYDGALGYLSGIAISVMLCRLLEETPQLSASELAISFFATYSTFDWWTDAVTISRDHVLKTASKEAMVIVSPSNSSICRNATLSTRARITACLSEAHEILLTAADNAWTALLVQDRLRGKTPRFFDRHRLYVVVHVEPARVGYLRSKLVGCIIQAERNGWCATPWPEPLRSGSRGGACFVIGCDGDLHPASLSAAVRAWRASCTEEEATCLTAEIREMPPAYKKVREREAHQQHQATEQGEQEEEEEEEEEREFVVPDGKTAEEIYKRIKWDPECNEAEFEIGYLDRFLGIVVIPVTKYKIGGKIPLHRIKFFKRRGVIIWSRGLDEEGNPWEF